MVERPNVEIVQTTREVDGRIRRDVPPEWEESVPAVLEALPTVLTCLAHRNEENGASVGGDLN